MNDHVMRYIIFTVCGEEYAISLQEVTEIMEPPPVCPIPMAPSYYRGMIHCHGRPMPVLDLASLYGRGSSANDGKMLVLDGKTANLSLLADRVTDIVSGEFPLTSGSYDEEGIERTVIVDGRGIKLIAADRLVEQLEEKINNF